MQTLARLQSLAAWACLAGGPIIVKSQRQHLKAPNSHTTEVVSAGDNLNFVIPTNGVLQELRPLPPSDSYSFIQTLTLAVKSDRNQKILPGPEAFPNLDSARIWSRASVRLPLRSVTSVMDLQGGRCTPTHARSLPSPRLEIRGQAMTTQGRRRRDSDILLYRSCPSAVSQKIRPALRWSGRAIAVKTLYLLSHTNENKLLTSTHTRMNRRTLRRGVCGDRTRDETALQPAL
jgi:hypothetical protein